jgi:hypothetical protein
MLEQLLAAVLAQLERGGLIGGLLSRAGDGFPHQVDGVLEALVEGGQLGVLCQLLVQRRRFLVRQLAQQERGEAGL